MMFWARSQNYEKRLLAESYIYVRMELGTHWTDFHDIWYLSTFFFFENVSDKF